MRALVVYESMFGNTRLVAGGVADGLSSGMTVDVVEVGAAPTLLDDEVELVVVGGPTHAFGMSRQRTRDDARKQAEQAGRDMVSTGTGMREWLEVVRPGSAGTAAAAFDTRVAKPRMPGSAARGADRRLRGRRFRPVARPESFWVSGSFGPLLEGEVERARRWGERLAAAVAATGRGASKS